MGLSEVFHIVLIAIGLTLLRLFLNAVIFKPIPKWFKIVKHDADKFPESAWKALYYSVAWGWAVYLCIFSEEQYFFKLGHHWTKIVPGITVEPSLYWLYMLQMGFYAHCVYASVFIETIRRDFTVLMIHHFLTLGLLSFSYAVRFHFIGLLVLFVQDIGDVSLEVSKCVLYFKTRNGKDHKLPEFLANISFAIFTIQWVLFRLYWFPTKVLYSTSYIGIKIYPGGPFYLPFNIMLMVLYAMQVYWFTFIVKVLVRVLSGKEVSDTRETKEDEAARAKSVQLEKKKN
ncbi:ceramide synthase 1-like [Gigantopelta aegis]|uniref:ceramide synthase 1-like n=1 Tax=Gigantopelta aegis TaxID=1735272 RepID=UPI001B88E259|nr:ceramide synthase 1-like [Gigantopelta aegis]